jgi:hypothetical protein
MFPKEYCQQNVQLQLDVKKFETIFFRSYFVLNRNNEKCSFSVAENELTKLDFG